MKHKIVALLFLICAATGVARAAGWPTNGSLTNSVTSSSMMINNKNVYFNIYSNWVYTDSVGVHSFKGLMTSMVTSGGPVAPGILPPQNANMRITDSKTGFVYQLSVTMGNTGSVSLTTDGYLCPKYQVLSVIYAPPGSKSYVDYGASFSMGSKFSVNDSFGMSGSMKLSASTGIVGTDISSNWKLTKEDTYSFSSTSSGSFDINVPGPLDGNQGLNHEYDGFYLWLNPEITVQLTGPGAGSYSLTNDPRDPVGGDVVFVYVRWLKNQALLAAEAPNTLRALQRAWSPLGALNSQDYATILARNPFWNGMTIVDSKRFDLQRDQLFLYQPAPVGGQPITEKYVIGNQETSTYGKTATDSYSVSDGGSAGIKQYLGVSGSTPFEWVHKVTNESSYSIGRSATLSITGPGSITPGGGYTGPTRFQVYKDNVYGTFMFAPVD